MRALSLFVPGWEDRSLFVGFMLLDKIKPTTRLKNLRESQKFLSDLSREYNSFIEIYKQYSIDNLRRYFQRYFISI